MNDDTTCDAVGNHVDDDTTTGATRREIFKYAAGAAVGVAAAGAIATPALAGAGPVNPQIPLNSPNTYAITPVRVYDSRWTSAVSGIPAAGLGRLSPGTSREIDCSFARGSTGVKTTPGVYAIPTWASAIYFNLTVDNCTGPNYLCIAPGNQVSQPATSIINFDTGVTLANGSIVGLSTDPTNSTGVMKVKVFCGDNTGSCHVVLDIMGYTGELLLLV